VTQAKVITQGPRCQDRRWRRRSRKAAPLREEPDPRPRHNPGRNDPASKVYVRVRGALGVAAGFASFERSLPTEISKPR